MNWKGARSTAVSLFAILISSAVTAAPTLDWSVPYTRTSGGFMDMSASFTETSSGDIYVLQMGDGWPGAWIARYGSAGTVAWALSLTGVTDAGIVDFVIDASGNYIFVGNHESPGELHVVKVSSAGVKLWERSTTHANGRGATGVAVDSSGNVVVAGQEKKDSTPTQDGLVVKYDGSGNLLWSRTINNFDQGDSCRGPAVDPATGNIFVVGGSDKFDFPYMPYVAAYGPDGGDLWTWTYTGGGFTFCRDVAFHPESGALYVAADNGTDYGVLKVDAATGAELGAFKIATANPLWEVASSIAVGSSGSPFVVGNTQNISTGEVDIQFAQFSAAADAAMWGGGYDSGNDDGGYDLTGRPIAGVGPGGDLFVAGQVNYTGCSSTGEVLVERYDPTGTRQWRVLYSGIPVQAAGGVAKDGGNVYAAITSGGWPRLLKFDTAGSLVWERGWTATPFCAARSIDVRAKMGRVYVAVKADPGMANTESVVLEYDAAGSLQRTMSHLDHDAVDPAIAVDSSGNLLMAAPIWNGVTSERDIIILRYDPSGDLAWSRSLSWGKVDEAVGLELDSSDNIYLSAGFPRDYIGTNAIGLLAFDFAGNLLWTRSVTVAPFQDATTGRVATGGGGVFVTGKANNTSYVYRFDTSGNLTWQKSFTGDSGWPASANGIEADVTGGLLVSAASDMPLGGKRMDTLYYEPNGTLRWRTGFASATGGGRDVTAGSVYALGDGGSKIWLAKYTDPSAALSASLSAPVEVSRGQLVDIVLRAANTGGSAAYNMSATLGLDSGAGTLKFVSASAPTMVAPGATANFTWTMSVTALGYFSFTATVFGTDLAAGGGLISASSGSATSVVPATLEAVVTSNTATIRQGRTVTLVMTVTNTGAALAQGVAASAEAGPSPAGVVTRVSGPLPAGPVSLAGGESVSFSWVYEGSLVGEAAFTVTVTGIDANSGGTLLAPATLRWSVTVSAGAALKAKLAVSPSTVKTGQKVSVVMTVSNTGELAAAGVVPALSLAGEGGGEVAGPVPGSAAIPAHGTAVFTWEVTARQAGRITAAATANGTDAGGAVGASATGSFIAELGIEEDLAVFPNPAAGDEAQVAFRLKKDASELRVDVYNTAMRRVYSATARQVPAGEGMATLAGIKAWAPGLYLVNVSAKSVDGSAESFRVVKLVVKR